MYEGHLCEQQQQVTTDCNEIYNEIKNRTNSCRAHLHVLKLFPSFRTLQDSNDFVRVLMYWCGDGGGAFCTSQCTNFPLFFIVRPTLFHTYGSSGREVEGVGLLPLVCWDRLFDSRRRNGCLFLVSIVCCKVEVFRSDILVVLNNQSSSSYICHGVGQLVDPFRSHVSRIPFKGLP